MEQYISKSALVAEIEKRISEYENCGIDNAAINAKIIALQSLLIYINTLEVKEIGVDIGSPEGDIGVKTIWDEDKIVMNKAQKGEEV